jgi:hypothetical protein
MCNQYGERGRMNDVAEVSEHVIARRQSCRRVVFTTWKDHLDNFKIRGAQSVKSTRDTLERRLDEEEQRETN